MEKWLEVVRKSEFRCFNHTHIKTFHDKKYTALASFAIDDALALSVTEGALPAIRFWVHEPTLVLGIPDARLPYLDKGLKFAHEQGYDAVIRNSGGLAVVLDEGVLNLSLILPGVKHLSIHECYEAMVFLVREMLADLTSNIEAYEIIGSYCPGDYDLSISGKKFAGISQRRVKEGAAIQIYLDITGNSRKRATFVREFYKLGTAGEPLKNPPPFINPDTMASLSELLGRPLTVDGIIQRAQDAIRRISKGFVPAEFTAWEAAAFEARYDQMIKRNERIGPLKW